MKLTPFYTLLLNLLPGVGAARYWQWLEGLGSVQNILLTSPDNLPGINKEASSFLKEFQQKGELSTLARMGYQVLEDLEKAGAELITSDHSAYPPLLQEIHRPPPVLYCRGNHRLLEQPQLAVIGTRNPTSGGEDNAHAFASFLAQQGFVITSGLALGVDAIAHKAALDVEGKTIAVMGSGINLIYPRRHQYLADRIVDEGGLLLTEFAPGVAPHASHFPQRNRIISGLSLGVLVVEAAVKSGSLITARYGLDQNREVFAIPGSIHNPQAKGCHALIKEGAQLVETAEDILNQLSGWLLSSGNNEDVPEQNALESEASEEQTNKNVDDLLSGLPRNPIIEDTDQVIFSQTDYLQEPKKTSVEKPVFKKSAAPPHSELSDTEQAVLSQIGHEAVDMDYLYERTEIPVADLSSALVRLQIKGFVKQTDWGFERINKVV